MQKRTIQKNRSSLTSWSFKVITQEVHEAIWQMRQSGYSQRRTALELDLHRRTVKSYWDREPGTVPPLTRTRAKWSDGHESRLRELFRETRNCDVVRRRLIEENVPVPSLRSVQKALKPFRSELKAAQAAKARQRVESLPGDVMQIDFGVKSLIIGGKQTKVHFFVAVLAYSRRRYVLVTENEDCTSWLQGIEGAFRRFGGIPNTILCDNAKTPVTKAAHVGGARHFTPNRRFEQFCHYWGVTPIASMPRYPQSKGKVERTVGYVKQNCLAHPVFESWETLKAHVTHRLDTVADAKVIRAADGTRFATMERFAEEKPYLKTMERPSFLNVTSMNRKVDAKGMLRVSNRYYALPVEYAGREVQVRVIGEDLEVFDAGRTVRKFNKTSGATKVITYETALDLKNPGFGNTVGTPPELKGIVSTPANNPLRRSFAPYAKILGGNHG